jgi:hypothetical protein
VKKWGGVPDDYMHIHTWFDESKEIIADFRHRALRHHAEGIFMAETIFGSIITVSTGRVIPVRWIGEQHVQEDLRFIPSFADWVRAIRPKCWMARAQRLDLSTVRLSSVGESFITSSKIDPALRLIYSERSSNPRTRQDYAGEDGLIREGTEQDE